MNKLITTLVFFGFATVIAVAQTGYGTDAQERMPEERDDQPSIMDREVIEEREVIMDTDEGTTTSSQDRDRETTDMERPMFPEEARPMPADNRDTMPITTQQTGRSTPRPLSGNS